MALNIQNMIHVIEQKITATSSHLEIVKLSNVLKQLKLNSVYSIDTFLNLPAAVDNEGNLYYVEDEKLIYWSTGNDWVIIGSDSYKLWTWGWNPSGQLGDGTTTSRSSPGTTIDGGNTWSKIEFGQENGIGVKIEGTLWVWGANTHGQIGDNTKNTRLSPVTTIGGGTTWDKVYFGRYHAMATKTDGTLWTWGNNLYGRLGDNTATSRSSPVTTAGGGTTWNNIAAAYQHSIATKTDGTLWTWGYNLRGQLGDNTTTSRRSPVTTIGGGTTWDKVAGGLYHSIATKTDGTLWTWGYNNYGQLGDNTITSRRSPGTTAGGGTNWDKVAAGANHFIATKTDGTLWTWGNNGTGQLGDNTNVSKRSPITTAGGGTNWNNIAGGFNHSIATKTDGTLWVWGINYYGQLGDGTEIAKSSPVTTAKGGVNWTYISSGSSSYSSAGIHIESL